MPIIPSPEDVLKDLSAFFPVGHAALDHGLYKAREFFEAQPNEKYRVPDPYLLSHLVRYYAIQVLETAGHSIKGPDDDKSYLRRIWIPNNGIFISCGHYNIRILKSDKGEPPAAGPSYRRQAYYSQLYHQMPLPFVLEDDEWVTEPTNILLLWDAEPGYKLGKISLVCPKAGGLTKDSIELYWRCVVPESTLVRPIEMPAFQGSADVIDLPLSLDMEAGSEARNAE